MLKKYFIWVQNCVKKAKVHKFLQNFISSKSNYFGGGSIKLRKFVTTLLAITRLLDFEVTTLPYPTRNWKTTTRWGLLRFDMAGLQMTSKCRASQGWTWSPCPPWTRVARTSTRPIAPGGQAWCLPIAVFLEQRLTVKLLVKVKNEIGVTVVDWLQCPSLHPGVCCSRCVPDSCYSLLPLGSSETETLLHFRII